MTSRRRPAPPELPRPPHTVIVAASQEDLIPLSAADPATLEAWVKAMQDRAARIECQHCLDSLVRAARYHQPTVTREDLRPFLATPLIDLPLDRGPKKKGTVEAEVEEKPELGFEEALPPPPPPDEEEEEEPVRPDPFTGPTTDTEEEEEDE